MIDSNRKYLFFPALAVGIIILVAVVITRQPPPLKPATESATPVRATEIKSVAIAPEVSGFGRVTPKVDWKAVAEVSGKVTYLHTDLEKGRVLPAGTLILKIDPLDYELKLAQAEADVAGTEAQLLRLEQQENNLQASIELEQARLVLAQDELKRMARLRESGSISQSDYDQQRQSFLSQKAQVQKLENQLALVPGDHKVYEAQLKVNQAKVNEARHALERTQVVLPVAARIASVNVEIGEAVSIQQQLVEAHGIETVEIEAQVALHDMKTLMNSFQGTGTGERARIDQLGLKAQIILTSADFTLEKEARVARISETVDPNQGTVGVILEVDQDIYALRTKKEPPLVNGLFVEARLTGKPKPHLVVPESALHGHTLYLIDDEQRMQPAEIQLLFRRDGLAVIESGRMDVIKASQQVVTNDLMPAIAGAKLKIVTDDAAAGTQE